MSFWDIFKKADKKTVSAEYSDSKTAETEKINSNESTSVETEEITKEHLWKSISIYVDRDYNLYGVPHSEDTTHQMTVAIEPITKLEYPYSDEQLEEFFKTVFGFCFSYYVEHDTLVNTRHNPKKDRSPIEKYMKARSWKAAVKDLGLIDISWYKKDGYRVSIYWQDAKTKNAFSGIGWEKDIIVPTDYKNSELAEAFRKFLDVLAIGPYDKNPYETE